MLSRGTSRRKASTRTGPLPYSPVAKRTAESLMIMQAKSEYNQIHKTLYLLHSDCVRLRSAKLLEGGRQVAGIAAYEARHTETRKKTKVRVRTGTLSVRLFTSTVPYAE